MVAFLVTVYYLFKDIKLLDATWVYQETLPKREREESREREERCDGQGAET